MVHLDKENFIGNAALQHDAKNGVARQLVGLEVDWDEVEEQHDKFGLTPAAPARLRAWPCRFTRATSRWGRRRRPRGLRC